MQAKGKAEPVEAWEAVEARARVGVDISGRVRTPLVGRRRELDTLLDAFERARSTRQAQLVTLVGEPGIGKSRLVYELFQTVEHDPELIYWRQGRSLPYGEGISFWALGEMVKAHAGILETDAKDEAEQKAPVDRRSCPAGRRRRMDSQPSPPVGGDRGRRGRGVRARRRRLPRWRGFLEGIADQSPLVLVFEDLHWADEGLLDFVDHLVDWATRVPLLVVGTARPELLARRPAWGGGKTNALTLSLAPLSGVETAELVHALLEQAAIPADIQATLLERAGGNPLYAEEFVRLLDERANGAALPETVQGIIAARLDVLDREEKELLQDAAVLGRMFWVGGLGQERDAAEQALHRLERREFVQRERRSTVAGETEYAFRHALVREVAYEQIPTGQRGEKHRSVADWLETLGRPDDLAELLAHHYIAVLDYSEPDARARRHALLAPWARREIGRSRSTRTQRLQVSTAARSTSAAERSEGCSSSGSAARSRRSRMPRLSIALSRRRRRSLAAGDPETAAAGGNHACGDCVHHRRCAGRDAPLVAPSISCADVRPRLRRRGRSAQAARFAMLDGRWQRRDRDRPGSRAYGRRSGPRRDPGRRARDRWARRGIDLGEPGGDADLELAVELAEAANAPLPSPARSTTSHGGTPASTWTDV